MRFAIPTTIPDAALLAAIVQSSADAIITKDLDGIITSWNSAAESLFGYSPEEAIGMSVTMLMPGDRVNEEPGILQRIRRGESVNHYETVRMTKDGRLVDISLTVSPILDEDGRIVGASKIARNISDRKLTETELKRFAWIIESSSDAIISKDLNGIIRSWNKGAENVFGYTEQEAVGQSVTMLIPEDRSDEEPNILSRLRRGEVVDHFQTVRRRKDGTLIDISLNISPVRDAHGDIVGASKIARDVTEHNRLESAEREAEIMHRLVQTQEDERRRIARDLHDQLGQHITAMRLILEDLTGSVRLEPSVQNKLADIRRLASSIDRDMSYLTWELRPAELERLGLGEAIDRFVSEWANHSGIETSFDHLGSEESESLAPAVETNLYRIVQEALNNVAKHSKASRVWILLHQQPGKVSLTVEDNGEGFDVASPPTRIHGHGNGLRGMRERVEQLGGHLEIESGPEQGTIVTVRVPNRGTAARSAAS